MILVAKLPMEALRPATVQRLYGFGVGVLAATAYYFSTSRLAWRQAAEVAQQYGYSTPKACTASNDAPLLGPKFWATLARRWNHGVDATLGTLAAELARRGY